MAVLVKIPLASAEYCARLQQPHIGMLSPDLASIFRAVFDSLLPFNLQLANIDVVTAGPLPDRKVTFKIPERGIAFQIGPEDYRFTKEGSSWQTAEQDVSVLLAAETAFLHATGAQLKSCQATIAMHLQPLGKTRDEILAPFVPEPFKSFLSTTQAQSVGSHLRWMNGEVLIDFSLVVANGIFMRMTSQFEGHPPLTDVLKKVRADEETLFELLGVQEDLTNA